jgi:ubiquinone/menaquinone biosynthesis C-methylase UbiE
MTDPTRDPENNETQHLLAIPDLQDARVLEIGTGNGRLAWRYAGMTRSVTAIELDPVRLAEAESLWPDELRGKVDFVLASAERIPFRNKHFDAVMLAWSM